MKAFSGYMLTALIVLTGCEVSAQEWAWTTTIGNDSSFAVRSLMVDSRGNAFVNAGSGEKFLAKFDPSGKLLWRRQGYGRALAADGDGNVVVTSPFTGTVVFGDTNQPGSLITLENPSVVDASFIVKFNPDGDVLWARRTDGWVTRTAAVGTDDGGNV